MHLSFRQIHLDFHTHGSIPDVGSRFDKSKFQDTLLQSNVSSVTCFAKCHHGWSYYETKVGHRHPNLVCELLDAQIEACHEVGIKVPIYISAGFDDLMAEKHPEWCVKSREGVAGLGDAFHVGFKAEMRWNSPYLDYLCEQIEEVMDRWKDADGIFLDIIAAWEDYSPDSLEQMLALRLDPTIESDVQDFAYRNLLEYYKRTTSAARKNREDMPVFHNGGNISIGAKETLSFNSHLELESLPTAGWGYDHFPLTVSYASTLDFDYLGMTGKFHNHWGEFGGYKRPDAMRYECDAMLANGAKCSIGDQLHPNGELNSDTYALIKHAYDDVLEKEEWCRDSEAVVQIGLVSAASKQGIPFGHASTPEADIGASRMLLEAQLPFQVLDKDTSWEGYDLIILPDSVEVNNAFAAKAKKYLAEGGRILASGISLMDPVSNQFMVDAGVTYVGHSAFDPDYIVPTVRLNDVPIREPLVIHGGAIDVNPVQAEVWATRKKPYFNRSWMRHCSHMHTPDAEDSQYPGITYSNGVVYFAHPIFTRYKVYGQPLYRDFVISAIKLLLDKRLLVETSMPSTGRLTLRRQPEENRYIMHLLHAVPVLRGESVGVRQAPLQILDDILPLSNVECHLRLPESIGSATLQPQGIPLDFVHKDGAVVFTLPSLQGHQIIELNIL